MAQKEVAPIPGYYYKQCDRCGRESDRITKPFPSQDTNQGGSMNINAGSITFHPPAPFKPLQPWLPPGWSQVIVKSFTTDVLSPDFDPTYLDYCPDCTNQFEFLPDRV